jgi:hypothetical protein
MAERQGLELLSLRKQALIAESDLNRLVLRVECGNLRAATRDFHGALAIARRLGPWLVPATAVGGLLAGNLLRKRSGVSGVLTTLIGWAPTALSLWRQFQGAREKEPTADAG